MFLLSDKAKLYAKNRSKNSNLDDLVISLPVLPSRTNLKLHNISVTPQMVKKVMANLDSSKASYILADLFNKCLKDFGFQDCWKVLLVIPASRNVGERATAKNYHPYSLLSVVSKVFEKLVNNRIFRHLKRCGLLSDFHV